MIKDYTHDINREVRAISGGYELDKEETLDLGGRTVLYAVGNALLDSSCCGFWGCRFAVVAGFVVHWKYRKSEEGLPVSSVEPITEEEVQGKIKRLLEAGEGVSQVRFL